MCILSHEKILELSNKKFVKEVKADRLLIGFDTSNENREGYLATATSIINDVGYMVSYGSSSSAMYRLASGQLSGYIHPAPYRWDICAAATIINELGGKVSDLEGNAIDWTKEKPAFLASYSEEIHAVILKLIKHLRA